MSRLVTYRRSAGYALGSLLDSGGAARRASELHLGDMVQHLLWVGSCGLLLARFPEGRTETFLVLWGRSPGPMCQLKDRACDDHADDEEDEA